MESSDCLVSILLGLIYGIGIMIGGALRPSIIIGFLNFSPTNWNPALLVLMITVTAMDLIIYMLIIGKP